MSLKVRLGGVIGLGNIGQRTADIAYALGMKIVSNSRRYHEGYEWLELDELCKLRILYPFMYRLQVKLKV